MCAPADSCRKGTRRIPCSSSAGSSGSISGDGRPKTKRTPSFARQRASSRPPFSSAIGHLLVRLAALVAALARGGPDVVPALTAGDGSPFSPQGGSSNVGRAVKSRRSEEHTSELQSPYDLVCRLLLEKKKKRTSTITRPEEDKHEK